MTFKKGDPFAIAQAKKGGTVKNPNKGFGTNRELAKIAGKKGGQVGGRISRRKIKKIGNNNG